jgi:hypothetical protein
VDTKKEIMVCEQGKQFVFARIFTVHLYGWNPFIVCICGRPIQPNDQSGFYI